MEEIGVYAHSWQQLGNQHAYHHFIQIICAAQLREQGNNKHENIRERRYLHGTNNLLVKGVELGGKVVEKNTMWKKTERERASPSPKGFVQKPVKGNPNTRKYSRKKIPAWNEPFVGEGREIRRKSDGKNTISKKKNVNGLRLRRKVLCRNQLQGT
ncbi:unnamed protein product [Sphenostylis stenocarpa]|uniref:Uncharacterized protein n=1 Tax=Sphenostylis stenocarpa TaxID=92480 RepID=A0AA86TGE3_9FABA|nr:unnamed protein product [Sphenostylis stenocarpa]